MPLLSQKALIRAPSSGTVTSGTENENDAGNYVFDTRVLRCWITNKNSNRYVYRLNIDASPSTAQASPSSYDGVLEANATTEVSLGGDRDIKDVSIFYPTGQAPAANSIRVMGLP